MCTQSHGSQRNHKLHPLKMVALGREFKLRRKTDADPSDLDELDLGPELQDGCNESDNTDGAPLQPGLTEPSEGAGQPDEPVAQPGAAEPSIQPGSAAPALQNALAGAEAAKPTGGEAQGAGAKALTPSPSCAR